MLDADTRARLDLARQRALHDGVDLFEVMKTAGLLRDEESINGDWADCLERLWMNIESQPVTALVQLGGGQNTPLDAIRGVLEYIDFFKKQYLRQSGRQQ
jgi:hypothetical protein